MNSVCVIGLGYIGLPTAALMANRGLEVYGIDCVQSVVDTINDVKNIKYDIFYKKFQVLLTYVELMIKNEFTIQ